MSDQPAFEEAPKAPAAGTDTVMKFAKTRGDKARSHRKHTYTLFAQAVVTIQFVDNEGKPINVLTHKGKKAGGDFAFTNLIATEDLERTYKLLTVAQQSEWRNQIWWAKQIIDHEKSLQTASMERSKARQELEEKKKQMAKELKELELRAIAMASMGSQDEDFEEIERLKEDNEQLRGQIEHDHNLLPPPTRLDEK